MNKRSRILTLSALVTAAFLGGASALPAAQAHVHTRPASTGLAEELDLIGDILKQVHARYVDEPSDSKMLEGAINGMLASLDPHSSYMNANQYAEMQEDMSGKFGGLGIEVKTENDTLKIVSAMEGAPAARAGLAPNDLITKIDGKAVDSSNIEKAVARMRGPLGTTVKLTISRSGVDKPFDVTLKRETIHVSPVKARAEGDVAYVAITSFTDHTSDALRKAVTDLKQRIGPSLKGYVVDLRNDPGGLLDEAVGVSSEFLKGGKIVSVKGRDNRIEYAEAAGTDITDGKPVIMLINGATASAAEIVTAALQDNKRATVVGTRSFGKGTVQNIIPLGNENGALRLTTARYFTPSGRSIQARGIDPDVVVEENSPAEIRSKLSVLAVPGEGALSNHLKNPAGDENAAPSLAYIPDKASDDTQLQYALGLLRGSPLAASGPAQKPAGRAQVVEPVAN